ncbi:4-hydroxythreonine-4-phosphate dehydrogenase [Hydrogenimonas cancrithermarum]|uniref:4-hydroxythreonine-4-phosphate dehydrogenase n=1 Tax=Hydrogenimonas cancrithermarum TaxID=2993563 RepID=A0ABM8FI27_9BACT|nr:4-hydroxythreonine-4-phosphate dehydrogenase [Hydrogenimonas cancrithermarum]BDY11942.1 4-hydroxythreonine-4-phosphate dehydrogenase [Hydrogenimonas cancrithermarum]
MNEKPRIAVSVGDPNGIGLEIALRAHETIRHLCRPLYFVGYDLLKEAAEKLELQIPEPFDHTSPSPSCSIRPGMTTAEAGAYSFSSFKKAVEAVENGACDAVVTLPINKEAWMKAGIDYKGHTDALRDFFKKEAIMMLGCEKLYVALFTEHIPLKEVPKSIEKEKLVRFLLDFQRETGAEKIGVLGLNPHAGDNGVLGNEEEIITEAVGEANSRFPLFHGPLVPDIAFSPKMRESFTYYVAMYHDQGLAPLKALYFDESINVSLNLPIVRTSVDHGTAFDIAYLQGRSVNLQSYIEAVKAAIAMKRRRDQRS